QEALHLDAADAEARAGLDSVRGQPKHEFRLGEDNDLLSYTSDYHDEWASLTSRWTRRWMTSVAGNFYQRAGDTAGKFVGAVTLREPGWGALTGGGAIGHDKAVIPKSEAFFGLDHGWKTGETQFLRGVEVVYGQHWYWYRSARVLTLSGTAIVYMPQDW